MTSLFLQFEIVPEFCLISEPLFPNLVQTKIFLHLKVSVGIVHCPCQVMDSNFQFRLAAGNAENENKGQILRYLTILGRSETQLYSG